MLTEITAVARAGVNAIRSKVAQSISADRRVAEGAYMLGLLLMMGLSTLAFYLLAGFLFGKGFILLGFGAVLLTLLTPYFAVLHHLSKLAEWYGPLPDPEPDPESKNRSNVVSFAKSKQIKRTRRGQ